MWHQQDVLFVFRMRRNGEHTSRIAVALVAFIFKYHRVLLSLLLKHNGVQQDVVFVSR